MWDPDSRKIITATDVLFNKRGATRVSEVSEDTELMLDRLTQPGKGPREIRESNIGIDNDPITTFLPSAERISLEKVQRTNRLNNTITVHP